MTVGTDAKELQSMRHVSETHLGDTNRPVFDGTFRQWLNALTHPADDVMMMVVLNAQLVANRPVAKIASVDEAEVFEFRKAAVYRDKIACSGGARLRDPLVQLIGRKRPVLTYHDVEHG